MPAGLYTITKLDLLALQACGFKLRKTTVFAALKLEDSAAPGANVGARYAFRPGLEGGVPLFFWEVTAGRLPPGLQLDSFTGQIQGVPTAAGTFAFRLSVRESGPGARVDSATFSIDVGDPARVSSAARPG
jgi:hypothetical protein